MSVCMYVLKRDISFPSDSKLTQHLPRYQFKFRIRTDYFSLVADEILIFFRFETENIEYDPESQNTILDYKVEVLSLSSIISNTSE